MFYPSERLKSLVDSCKDNFSNYILIHSHPSQDSSSGGRGRRRRKVSDAATKLGGPLDVVHGDGDGQVPDDGVQAVRLGQDGKDGHGK